MTTGGIITVTSLDLPPLGPYLTLRRSAGQRAAGVFVAEGLKVVDRLLASGLDVVSMLTTPEMLERLRPGGADFPFPVYRADKRLLEKITGCRMHQGIMAIGRIPPERPLGAVLEHLSAPLLLAALDGIAHADNTGVIVRNCAAFGVQAVIAGANGCSPYLRRAVRNSMGAVFLLPVVHATDLPSVLAELAGRGVAILGTDPHADRPIDLQDLTRDLCLVFGSEEAGISPEVRASLTERVAIPMPPGVDSLNVSSASAVALYEVRRQRASRRHS
jgi:tRNA G18 (ribose-2'-O)-methylase SpoU